MSGKILVVDDTADTRELFHLYLTRAGYAVIEAADGREGVFRAKTDKPDVIITDIMMPDMDGYALIGAIRGAPEIAATPIIALTAYGAEKLKLAKEVGANEARSKPMNLGELVNLVGRMLDATKP
jgi:CheY-like chemotaxis protein